MSIYYGWQQPKKCSMLEAENIYTVAESEGIANDSCERTEVGRSCKTAGAATVYLLLQNI
jgi:hypothetical protein